MNTTKRYFKRRASWRGTYRYVEVDLPTMTAYRVYAKDLTKRMYRMWALTLTQESLLQMMQARGYIEVLPAWARLAPYL
jgi:hypothetical protein